MVDASDLLGKIMQYTGVEAISDWVETSPTNGILLLRVVILAVPTYVVFFLSIPFIVPYAFVQWCKRKRNDKS